MKYILTSITTGLEHVVDEQGLNFLKQKIGFHRKYTVAKLPERRIPTPVEIILPETSVDQRRKRVAEPKTEEND